MAAPETEAREALIASLKTVFATEKYPIVGDKLHQSMGQRETAIGVSPVRSAPWAKDYAVNQYEILVQFYHKYTLEVNPEQIVDPGIIEGYADRFRKGIETADPKTTGAWYFTVIRVMYPDDPTGNKSRFEAFVTCWGQGLVA